MLRMLLTDKAGYSTEGLIFHMADKVEEELVKEFGEATVQALYRGTGRVFLTLAFSPRINEFRGRKTAQVLIQNFKATK